MPNDIQIPGLERSDFERPPRSTKPRIIYNVQGVTKTGKSTFPFWGPGPIAVFDFDRRLETVVQRAISGKLTGTPKEIVWIPFKMPSISVTNREKSTMLEMQAKDHLDKFIRNFKMALESSMKKGGIRTISIDTGTELLDLRKCSEFGRVASIPTRDLGGVNQDMSNWMRLGEDYNANVVWVHHVKDEWVKITGENGRESQAPSGNKVIDGWNKSDQACQVTLETAVRGDKFQLKVLGGSGLNSKTNGKVYTANDWGEYGPFAWISAQQLTKTEPEDWL